MAENLPLLRPFSHGKENGRGFRRTSCAESPSLEIFKPRLDAVLCSLLWVTLLRQGVGLGDPQRALPTPTMLGFWEILVCNQLLKYSLRCS